MAIKLIAYVMINDIFVPFSPHFSISIRLPKIYQCSLQKKNYRAWVAITCKKLSHSTCPIQFTFEVFLDLNMNVYDGWGQKENNFIFQLLPLTFISNSNFSLSCFLLKTVTKKSSWSLSEVKSVCPLFALAAYRIFMKLFHGFMNTKRAEWKKLSRSARAEKINI